MLIFASVEAKWTVPVNVVSGLPLGAVAVTETVTGSPARAEYGWSMNRLPRCAPAIVTKLPVYESTEAGVNTPAIVLPVTLLSVLSPLTASRFWFIPKPAKSAIFSPTVTVYESVADSGVKLTWNRLRWSAPLTGFETAVTPVTVMTCPAALVSTTSVASKVEATTGASKRTRTLLAELAANPTTRGPDCASTLYLATAAGSSRRMAKEPRP